MILTNIAPNGIIIVELQNSYIKLESSNAVLSPSGANILIGESKRILIAIREY